MVPLMSRFWKDFRATALACLLCAAIGAHAARADALPMEDLKDPTASSSADPLARMRPGSSEDAVRQHVKHLRAHKKSMIDAAAGSNQLPDKADNAQSSSATAAPADSGQKIVVGGAPSSATEKSPAKSPAKISRARKKNVVTTRSGSGGAARVVREKDFFSDLFGSDD